MKNRYTGFIALSCVWLSSCVNLKAVHTFSTSAAVSLQQGSALPATFTQLYQKRVVEDSLSRHPFNRIPVIGIDFESRIQQGSTGQWNNLTSPLRSYQLADSLVGSGTALLLDYFDVLANLSTTGKAAATPTLKSPTFEHFLQNSAIKLTPDQVVAFNRVINVVVSAATGAYRRRELIDLLEQSHGDIQQLLSVLVFAHQRLIEVVALSRDQRYGYYKNLLIRDPTLTYVQKYELAKQWLKTDADIEQTRQAILLHTKSLKTIQEGYEDVYKHRSELKSRALLAEINAYVSVLQQVRTDLNQLKPVYGRLDP